MDNLKSSENDAGIIMGVKTLCLENYRGFKGKHTINTDADIILLTGPNGFGKTSFLEGLLYTLTGWSDKVPQDLVSLNEDFFYLKAEATGKDNEGSYVSWDKDKNSSKTVFGGAYNPADGKTVLKDPELLVRLCGFFQDRVSLLFDEFSTGKTLRDVFEPIPPGIIEAQETLSKKDDIEKEIRELHKKWLGPSSEELTKILLDTWGKVQQSIHRITDQYLKIEQVARKPFPFPPSSNNIAYSNLSDYFVNVLQSQGIPSFSTTDDFKAFKGIVENIITILMVNARKMAAGRGEFSDKWDEEIETLEEQIDQIKKKYPNIEKEINLFPANDPDDPDLLSVFRTLARNAKRWGQMRILVEATSSNENEKGTRFLRIFEEIAAVQEQEAGKCAEMVEAWFLPRKEAFEKLQLLQMNLVKIQEDQKMFYAFNEIKEIIRIKVEFDRNIRPFEKAWEKYNEYLAWARSQANRREAGKFLNDAIQIITIAGQTIDKIKEPNDEIKQGIKMIAKTVLGRFSLVEGILELELEPDDWPNTKANNIDRYGSRRVYGLHTIDKRKFVHFSTGQRSQIGISFLVAQNLAVSDRLSHKVLILDDVSTSYDLSNLTREAILWRQLAYGSDDQFRRQIFISSHHEDMTSHLLDLLVPPKGRTMRLLRFTDWSPDEGPTIQNYRVIETQSAEKNDSKAVQNFISDMENLVW